MNNNFDVIDAFADGEPVAPDALDRALADADGRQHLIDLLVLRGFAMSPQLAPVVAPPRAARPYLRWSIAALVAIAAGTSGYVAGSRTADARNRLQVASISSSSMMSTSIAATTSGVSPDASSTAAPATSAATTSGSSTTTAASTAAPPAPTRVIRFEPGVDWTEHQGGLYR